jgi:hypothetical protein
MFAAAKPVTLDILARVVGHDCTLDLLLDDLKEDLRGWPIELATSMEGRLWANWDTGGQKRLRNDRCACTICLSR